MLSFLIEGYYNNCFTPFDADITWTEFIEDEFWERIIDPTTGVALTTVFFVWDNVLWYLGDLAVDPIDACFFWDRRVLDCKWFFDTDFDAHVLEDILQLSGGYQTSLYAPNTYSMRYAPLMLFAFYRAYYSKHFYLIDAMPHLNPYYKNWWGTVMYVTWFRFEEWSSLIFPPFFRREPWFLDIHAFPYYTFDWDMTIIEDMKLTAFTKFYEVWIFNMVYKIAQVLLFPFMLLFV